MTYDNIPREITNTSVETPVEEGVKTVTVEVCMEKGVLFPKLLYKKVKTYLQTKQDGPLEQHSFDGEPSHVHTDEQHIKTMVWHANNLKHRTGGPASLVYNGNGKPIQVTWCLQGGEGRLSFGPTEWFFDGSEDPLLTKSWIYGKGSLNNEPDPRGKYIFCSLLECIPEIPGVLRALYRNRSGAQLVLENKNPWIGPHQPNPPLCILILACEGGPDSPSYSWGLSQATEEQKKLLTPKYFLRPSYVSWEGVRKLTLSFSELSIQRSLVFSPEGEFLYEEIPVPRAP